MRGGKEPQPRKTAGGNDLKRWERTEYDRGMWDAVHRQEETEETGLEV